jgi:hypothetical protein
VVRRNSNETVRPLPDGIDLEHFGRSASNTDAANADPCAANAYAANAKNRFCDIGRMIAHALKILRTNQQMSAPFGFVSRALVAVAAVEKEPKAFTVSAPCCNSPIPVTTSLRFAHSSCSYPAPSIE